MRSFFSLLAALASAIGFYGCDSFNLKALQTGVSTAQTVRERLGPPTAEWPNADGSKTWEYPRGPAGFKCWMITLDARGILLRIDQTLTEDNFARVEKGWTFEQVRRLLGKPASEATFPLKPEIVWEWRIEPTISGNNAFFHVHFNMSGRVTGTSRREETAV